MTDPERRPLEDVEEQADRLEDDAEAMDRPDRAIPLPDQSGAGDDVGPVPGVAP